MFYQKGKTRKHPLTLKHISPIILQFRYLSGVQPLQQGYGFTCLDDTKKMPHEDGIPLAALSSFSTALLIFLSAAARAGIISADLGARLLINYFRILLTYLKRFTRQKF